MMKMRIIKFKMIIKLGIKINSKHNLMIKKNKIKQIFKDKDY